MISVPRSSPFLPLFHFRENRRTKEKMREAWEQGYIHASTDQSILVEETESCLNTPQESRKHEFRFDVWRICILTSAAWIKRRLSVTNFSSENNLLTFWLNAPVVIVANIGKLFSKLKLVTDNLFIYAEANWEATESSCMSSFSEAKGVHLPLLPSVQQQAYSRGWWGDCGTDNCRTNECPAPPESSESFECLSLWDIHTRVCQWEGEGEEMLLLSICSVCTWWVVYIKLDRIPPPTPPPEWLASWNWKKDFVWEATCSTRLWAAQSLTRLLKKVSESLN